MALAEKGGVIGVTAFPRMLCSDPDRNCTIERVHDCIDYVVNLVGENHVGIRLDFAEGWAEFPVTRRVLIKIDGRIIYLAQRTYNYYRSPKSNERSD